MKRDRVWKKIIITNITFTKIYNTNVETKVLDPYYPFWRYTCCWAMQRLKGVLCANEKLTLTGSLAFSANTAKVEILLQRHLVWTAGDGSVLQPSASQFSSPASLLIGQTYKNKWRTDIQRCSLVFCNCNLCLLVFGWLWSTCAVFKCAIVINVGWLIDSEWTNCVDEEFISGGLYMVIPMSRGSHVPRIYMAHNIT